MQDFIANFGVLLLVVVMFSLLVKLLKQPIILGYVLAGALVSFLALSSDFDTNIVSVFGSLGITFLLFLIGLEFDLKIIKYYGKDILIGGLLQSFLYFVVGYFISVFFGLSQFDAVLIGILGAIGSSTLLVGKWLEDKKQTNTLYGQMSLGLLIIQDMIAILAITGLTLLDDFSAIRLFTLPLYGLLLISIGFILAKIVLNKVFKFSASHPELLFVVSLGVCFFFVLIAPYFGYSSTIGAFIGGIVVANTIYGHDISSRLKTLVTFFNMLFFVGLGFQLDFSLSAQLFLFIFVLCFVFMILKPIVTYISLRMLGYDIKTAFIPALYLNQFSEFGIVLLASASQASSSLVTITTISILATMILSSHLIKYAERIYEVSYPFLQFVDQWFPKNNKEYTQLPKDYNIIFFGYYQLSQEILSKFENTGKKIVVVENNPQNIELLKTEKIPYVFNTVNNHIFFDSINFSKVHLVISSLQDITDNRLIVEALKEKNPSATAIVSSRSLKDALSLYDAGADYVIYPTLVNEQHISVLLEDYTTNIDKVLEKKLSNIAQLKKRQQHLQVDRSSTSSIEDFLQKVVKTAGNSAKSFTRMKK